MQEMNEKLDRVLNTVTSLKILLTIISNRTASDGSETPYMIVPNARGEMPGDNLPDITKLDHLVYMAAGALTGYCHFYGCNPTLLLTDYSKRKAVATAIGVNFALFYKLDV
eukprot:Colp12_sorted_trinity150504_noHs@30031